MPPPSGIGNTGRAAVLTKGPDADGRSTNSVERKYQQRGLPVPSRTTRQVEHQADAFSSLDAFRALPSSRLPRRESDRSWPTTRSSNRIRPCPHTRPRSTAGRCLPRLLTPVHKSIGAPYSQTVRRHTTFLSTACFQSMKSCEFAVLRSSRAKVATDASPPNV